MCCFPVGFYIMGYHIWSGQVLQQLARYQLLPNNHRQDTVEVNRSETTRTQYTLTTRGNGEQGRHNSSLASVKANRSNKLVHSSLNAV